MADADRRELSDASAAYPDGHRQNRGGSDGSSGFERYGERLKFLNRRSDRLFRYRVLFFVAGLAVLPLPLPVPVRFVLFLAAAAGFAIVAVLHGRTDRGIRRTTVWERIKREQNARATLDWEHIPLPISAVTPHDHPFGPDLDITGEESLHQLLDISVSVEGSELLASWLLDPYPDETIVRERQRLVRELAPMHRFRERLLLGFHLVSREPLRGNSFIRWLQSAQLPRSIHFALPVSAALASLNWILFVLYGLDLLPPWFLLTLTAYTLLYFLNSQVRASFLEAAVVLDDELRKLKELFRFLERYPYGSHEDLRNLVQPFLSPDKRPSSHIRRIRTSVIAAGLSMNPVTMMLLNLAGPWDFYFAWKLDRRRRDLADVLPDWMNVLHRLEALLSLSNFASLNPGYTMPQLQQDRPELQQDRTPLLEATGLCHPLLPPDEKICNDLTIASVGEVLLVTGSNMAGKSTFLRTVGINAVLAYAGAPVNAKALRLPMYRVYTCINISDSLREGVSYFYAEVRRLKDILNQIEHDDERPVLFLIDEIFKGTNNIERRKGSSSYLKAVTGRNGVGIVSTHDIELSRLEEKMTQLLNVHFREDVRGDRMLFDYRLRPGPCPTTNALVIMRRAGLPVEEREN